MEKSTHKVEVVRIGCIGVHPNADRLERVIIFGYEVCVGKGDFKGGDLAIYLPPDSVVPQDDRFKFVWESKGYTPPPVIGDIKEAAHRGFLDEDEYYARMQAAKVIPEKYRRIKAKILRGVTSEGLLMPLSTFWPLLDERSNPVKEGDDVASLLGITHYDPPEVSLGGDCEVAPIRRTPKKRGYPRTIKGWVKFIWHKIFPKNTVYGMEESVSLPIPNYDVDAWQRHSHLLDEGEPIWVTEKIHGSNARFVYMPEIQLPGLQLNYEEPIPGRMYVGSHYQWKKDVAGSAYWEALKQNPWIESFCRRYPGYVLYGELCPTQKLKYGLTKDHYRVFAFDVLDTNQKPAHWLSMVELDELDWRRLAKTCTENAGILNEQFWVPTIFVGTYNPETIRSLASGPSMVEGAKHIREGIVIKPMDEKIDPRFGRVILKIVSPEYLASKSSDE